MAGKGNMSDMHSPARGLTDGFAVGGGSTPAMPTWHPDDRLTDKSGMAEGNGVSPAPDFAGVGASDGPIRGVQLVDAPSTYDAGGDSMVGGLGTPPRP